MPILFWVCIGLAVMPYWLPAERSPFAEVIRGKPPDTCGEEPHPHGPAAKGTTSTWHLLLGLRPATSTGGFG